jgi:hypothetical protein
VTATRNLSGGTAKAMRAASRPDVRSTWRIARRTGAPVTTARGNGESSKATAEAAAKRAVRALARPGRRSNETTRTGTRRRRAANTAGRLA